jgi:hypothetical protein
MYISRRQFRFACKTVVSVLSLFAGCLPITGNVLAGDIDLMQPCDNPSKQIPAALSTELSIIIGTVNAPAGHVAWRFTSAPVGFGGVSCATAPGSIDCNGVIVTLPAPAPDSQATITGMAASGTGGFAMTLEAAVGFTGCTREYVVNFVDLVGPNPDPAPYDLITSVTICSGNICGGGDWPVGEGATRPTPYGDCIVTIAVDELDVSRKVENIEVVSVDSLVGDASDFVITKTEMHPSAYDDPDVRKNLRLCGYVDEVKDRRARVKLGITYEPAAPKPPVMIGH